MQHLLLYFHLHLMPIHNIHKILVFGLGHAHIMEPQIELVGGVHSIRAEQRETPPPEYPIPGTRQFSTP